MVFIAIVNKPKVNGVYFAFDNHLKVGNCSSTDGHVVIVTSINKKNNTARVKTVTSLEDYDSRSRRWRYRLGRIDDVKNGNILPIPIREFGTRKFSGVDHNTRTVKLNQLHYKSSTNHTRFPKRYEKLIHRK